METLCLAGLALALPLAEAPKNILCVLYGLIWLWNRLRARDWGGRWDAWDSLIALWLASGFVVACGAAIHHSEWRGATDIVRYGGILWCVKRSRYGAAEFYAVTLSLIAAALIGLGIGYWDRAQHRRYWLELRSVGHVNHSAAYLAIVLGLATGVVLENWARLGLLRRSLGAAACAFLGLSLMVMSSRGAIGAAMAFMLLLALLQLRRSRLAGLLIVLALGAAVLFAIVGRTAILDKYAQDQTESTNTTAIRIQIWHLGMAAWRLHPWFGVGMDNFSHIDREQLIAEAAARQVPIEAEQMRNGPHGHSLLFNTLAERGLAGSAVLLAVLLAWLASLVRGFPGEGTPVPERCAWLGAGAALVVSLIAGLVNTPLHHEQGILSMLLLGFWLALRGRPAARVVPAHA